MTSLVSAADQLALGRLVIEHASRVDHGGADTLNLPNDYSYP
jgi:hypothetical protein